MYARAECLEQKLDFYTRPACTQFEVFDLPEFVLKYKTVALDNCKIIIAGHTSRLVTDVTFRALQSQHFVMEASRINLLLPQFKCLKAFVFQLHQEEVYGFCDCDDVQRHFKLINYAHFLRLLVRFKSAILCLTVCLKVFQPRNVSRILVALLYTCTLNCFKQHSKSL